MGRSPPPPFFDVISEKCVHEPWHEHCTVYALYAYLMCEEILTVAAVPVQKMLRRRLLFSRMRERSPGQGLKLCLLTLVLLPFVREKSAVCMHLAHAWCDCPWNKNLINLNYFGDKKEREENSNDYSLVMILHSSAGLVNWLSRTTATSIWVGKVPNAEMKTWGNIKSCRRFQLVVVHHMIVSGAP